MKRFLTTSLLLFAAATVFAQSVAEAVAKVNAANAVTSTSTFDVRTVRNTSMLSQPLVSTGKVFVKAPSSLRYEGLTPARSLFVLDGDRVLTESKGVRKTTDLKEKSRYQALLRSISRSSTDGLVSEKDFNIEVLSGKELILVMKPLGRDLSRMFSEIRLRADSDSGVIREVLLRDIEGDTTSINISNVVICAPLSVELFNTK
ncbi:MAG: outer membrane lipoprotein carrier protein LolA [Bacteroidales bacterium]|nr:outer membrane lipoprotein carrier protein LolA [Bacteroidales bacterium]